MAWAGGAGFEPGQPGASEGRVRAVPPAGGGAQSFWRGRPSPELEGPRSPARRGPGR